LPNTSEIASFFLTMSILLVQLSLGLLLQPLQPSVPRARCAAPCLVERTPGPRTAGAPPPDDLSDEAMLAIVLQEMPDEAVNALIWKYLGYRYDEAAGAWDASAVFPKWAAKYPQPPDLVGVTRTYTKAVDEPVLRAVQSLQRSVPKEHKNNLRCFLKPLGWKGYTLEVTAACRPSRTLSERLT
jgi:hypothetical protein